MDGEGGWISVNGDWFYCKNHGWNLTGHLGNGFTLSATAETDWTDDTEGYAIWVLEHLIEPKITAQFGTRSALTLTRGDWHEVSDKRKAALEAFATKFYGNPSTIVQHAVWEYIHNYEDSSCRTEGRTPINDAADYYADYWSNRGDNKPQLTGSSSNAKARILGSDYVVGPFWISYDDTIKGNIKFVESLSYSISVPGAQLTDVNGNSIGGVPNGSDFYIKFPYNETLEEVSIEVSLHYIDGVNAREMDIKTQGYEFELVWDEPETESVDRWQHGSECWDNPGEIVNDSTCQYCIMWKTEGWKATAERTYETCKKIHRKTISKHA